MRQLHRENTVHVIRECLDKESKNTIRNKFQATQKFACFIFLVKLSLTSARTNTMNKILNYETHIHLC